jgi:Type III flagellar switch regulator (C-ring) FliN C-term
MFSSRMATAAHPITPPPPFQPAEPSTASPEQEAALVPAGKPASTRLPIDAESVVARLPVELEVGVPVHNFRVRNLLTLEPGVLVASHWSHGEDLPLIAGDVQLAWTEFEVVINSLAARITRIA